METDAVGRLRFGVTVGKRNAHRSVDRATVKRILREKARLKAPRLRVLVERAEKPVGLDVSLRLKVPLTVAGASEQHKARKRLLAQDAEKLLAVLEARIRQRYAG